jgi:hypothetical protein
MRLELAEDLGPNRAMILTETWTEAGFMPFEREINFWADLIVATVPSSTRLVLKGHPVDAILTQDTAINRLQQWDGQSALYEGAKAVCAPSPA